MTFLTAGEIKDSRMGSQGAFAHVSHFGTLKSAPTYPVLKANFPGVTLNTALWTENTVGAGSTTVTQGVAEIDVTTANGDSVTLQSVDNGIFEAGQVTVYQSGVFADTGIANNRRVWGLMDNTAQNGLFFRWEGATFQVVARKAGVDTSVDTASFNGEPGWVPPAQNNTFRIFYSAGRSIFCRASAGNIKTLHTMVDGQYPLVDDLDLGLYYENTNFGVTAAPVTMRVRGASSSLFGQLPTSRANGAITDTTVLELTKSVITARDTSGGYRNINANTGSALLTADFNTEVALGLVPNYSSVLKFGSTNPLPASTAPRDVWRGGGVYTGQPVGVSGTLTVTSTNANDTNGGTGAHEIRLFGLDAAFEEITEDVTLNGGSIATTLTFSRMNRAFVLTAGSGGENAGDIGIALTGTPTTIFANISAGVNQTQLAAYTVPANKTATLISYNFGAGRNGGNGIAEMRLLARDDGGVYRVLFENVVDIRGGLYTPNLAVPIVLQARTDIVVRIVSTTDASMIMSASFGLIIVNN